MIIKADEAISVLRNINIHSSAQSDFVAMVKAHASRVQAMTEDSVMIHMLSVMEARDILYNRFPEMLCALGETSEVVRRKIKEILFSMVSHDRSVMQVLVDMSDDVFQCFMRLAKIDSEIQARLLVASSAPSSVLRSKRHLILDGEQYLADDYKLLSVQRDESKRCANVMRVQQAILAVTNRLSRLYVENFSQIKDSGSDQEIEFRLNKAASLIDILVAKPTPIAITPLCFDFILKKGRQDPLLIFLQADTGLARRYTSVKGDAEAALQIVRSIVAGQSDIKPRDEPVDMDYYRYTWCPAIVISIAGKHDESARAGGAIKDSSESTDTAVDPIALESLKTLSDMVSASIKWFGLPDAQSATSHSKLEKTIGVCMAIIGAGSSSLFLSNSDHAKRLLQARSILKIHPIVKGVQNMLAERSRVSFLVKKSTEVQRKSLSRLIKKLTKVKEDGFPPGVVTKVDACLTNARQVLTAAKEAAGTASKVAPFT